MNVPIDINQIPFYRDKLQLRETAKEVLEFFVASLPEYRSSLACILFDLDCFYEAMQSLTPETAQAILLECLTLLQQHTSSRQAMSLGRDEFLVVAPNIRLEEAMFLAENLRTQLSAAVAARLSSQIPSHTCAIGCSAGLALYPNHSTDIAALLLKAREGLYVAKRQGRNLTKLPPNMSMVLKANYYPSIQLERLGLLSQKLGRTEASLLREALERLLGDYDI